MVVQESLSIQTAGREIIDVTPRVAAVIRAAAARCGICNLFLHHTSASSLLCENADQQVRHDLEAFFQRLAVDGDPLFKHMAEGIDDMPAHVRSVLTGNSVSVPVRAGSAALGTWQGIFVWEHRTSPHVRDLTVTIYGDQ